METKG